MTTSADRINGDVSSALGLLANPGPDGISLREAIEATNNDPDSYAIRFAPALAGTAIELDSDLPPLSGGGVTIEGSGVTLTAQRGAVDFRIGFRISSSRNRLHALTLDGFDNGVTITPPPRGTGDFPSQRTFADNSVSDLVMHGIRSHGITLDTWGLGACGMPCSTHNRWVNTAITDNTIEARNSGIFLGIHSTGDRIEHATVTGNTIRVVGDSVGPGINVSTLLDSTGGRIADVLVARNSIEGSPDIGIQVAPGTGRAQEGLLERVRVLDNRLHLVGRGSSFCCQGIVVQAGSDSPGFAEGPPIRYLDDSIARDVVVRGNSIGGTLAWGIQIVAAYGGGGRRNRVENVRIERNAIRSVTIAAGVYLVLADGTPFRNRFATGNRILGVSIDGNRIAIGRSASASSPHLPGGIALQAGGPFGRGNSIRNVRITNNEIASSKVGIAVVGGWGRPSYGNRVSCVRLARNRITGTHTRLVVTPNLEGAKGNRASLGGC